MKHLYWINIFWVLISCAHAGGETTSANMGLTIPAVGVTTGPQWASDINATLNVIDLHDHSSGKGVAITPAGLNINSDLSCGSNNLTTLRSVRFASNGAAISGASDLGALYEVANDLYYNDGAGNQIRITQSGSVSGSSGTITGLPSGTASAAFSSGTFTFLQSTGNGANMDTGTLILRYPGSYPSPAGNFTAIQANSSLATGYAYTLPAALPGANGAMLTSSTAGAISYTNVDGTTLAWSSGTLSVGAGGVQQTNIYTRSLQSTTATAGNVARIFLSASATSSSCAAIGSAITVVSTGRPMMILLSNSTGSGFGTTSTAGLGRFYLLRDDTTCDYTNATLQVGIMPVGTTGGQFKYPAAQFMEVPSAGSHTYKLVVVGDGSTTLSFSGYLIAYEIN